MSATIPDHHLTPERERATLLVLGAVQFTHFLDLMIKMPLGGQLMRAFNISPTQFTHLVTSYERWRPPAAPPRPKRAIPWWWRQILSPRVKAGP